MNFKTILAFLVVYLVWGSTFGAIKVGLESFPPFLMASMRFLISGIAFLCIADFKEIRSMSRKEVKTEFTVGLLLNFSNAVVCWAQQFVPTGIAALIVGAVPVMFILFNWISFEKKMPHPSALFAFAIGLTGIMLISMDRTAVSNWWVVGVLILANTTWVAGSLLFRMSSSKRAYFPRAAVQMLFGGTFLFIMSNVLGERSVNFSEVQLSGYLSVAYLAFFGTVIAYTAYSYLLKNVKPEMTSTYALVNPLVALTLGVLFFKESFTPKIAYSAGLILMSVVLVLYGDKLFRRLVPVLIPVRKNNAPKEPMD